jgi:F0F1-type ATP synthase membrane subunit c/vacuolar-type H+-ATPase subunit K
MIAENPGLEEELFSLNYILIFLLDTMNIYGKRR